MDINTNEFIESYVNPLIPMTMEASKITGITDIDLRDKKPFSHHIDNIVRFIFERHGNEKDIYLIAHNGDSFDKLILLSEFKRLRIKFPIDRVKFVDTLKISRTLYKDSLTKFNMNSLRTFHGLTTKNAHSSFKDVVDLCVIYNHMKEKKSVQELYDLSIHTCSFGKYKNWDYRKIPKEYLQYIFRKNVHLYHEDLFSFYLRERWI